MPSDLNRFLARGFARAARVIGTSELVAGAVHKPAILGNAQLTKTLMDSGLWQKVTNTAELTHADFAALALTDRKVVTIDATRYTIILIEPADAADPCVRVHLRLAHLS